MELKLPKDRAQTIGLKKLEPFGMNEGSWNWKGMGTLDLRTLNTAQRQKLKALLQKNKEVHGVKMMLYDLNCYERALADPTAIEVRNIRTFAALLQAYLKPLPRHQVYVKDDDDENIRLPYYVNSIVYHKKVTRRGYETPAHVILHLMWEHFGGSHSQQLTWYQKDVRGKTISQILAAREVYPETEDFRLQYQDDLKRWDVAAKQVGKQYLGTGTASDDVDVNDGESHWHHHNQFSLDRDDGPSRVVADVFFENKNNRDDNVTPDLEFWKKMISLKGGDEDDDDVSEEEIDQLREEEEAFEKGTAEETIEVPIHPYLAVFDLRRHMRLKVHINNLTEYKYDPEMANKLVLPPESKHLVHILVEHKDGGFKDIVKGKGGGAIVLLCGPPGTGKTLTAEVYAESEEKALYSVQASQLGTDEEELEKELTKVLARGKRWGAIMLIDEADVYVHTRGNDLQQNAIVGVFLRVLEYHSSILFLTTNRPELVDDAVASRCIARIVYKVPSIEDQRKIWRILADQAGIKIAPADLNEIVTENTKLAGRDIKNLLKLAQLFIASGDQKKVTAETIKFVSQFKPTD